MTPKERAADLLKSGNKKALTWITERIEQEDRIAAAKRNDQLTEQVKALGYEVMMIGQDLAVSAPRDYYGPGRQRWVGFGKHGLVVVAIQDLVKKLRQSAGDLEQLIYRAPFT